MDRLWKRYRPRSLKDVVGQPPVTFLSRLAKQPQAICVCLSGPPGVGKTASALALASDLGCYDETTFPRDNPPAHSFGFNTGLFTVLGSELTIDCARELFGNKLRLRYGSESGFCVLLLEEMEYLSPQTQTFLKTALETKLPANVIVVATSNDVSKIQRALMQRFKHYTLSAGPAFMAAAHQRLEWIWAQECPGEKFPPIGYTWGIDTSTLEFSLREALSAMEDHQALFSMEGMAHAG